MAPRHAGKATVALSMFIAVLVVHQTIRGFSRLGEETESHTHSHDVVNASSQHHKYRLQHGRVLMRDTKDDVASNKVAGGGSEVIRQQSACTAQKLSNFFSAINHSFVDMLKDLDQPIKTKPYLECSADLALIFDKLSATAFSPVKSNFNKNIKIITTLYNKDREKYSTLQAMVEEDVKHNRQTEDDSVSDSILWLTRSLLFIAELFDNFEDEEYLSGSVTIAYDRVLRQYHNFFVRKLFGLIAPALPSKASALAAFATNPADVKKTDYAECLYEKLDIYNDALFRVCNKLEDYFKTYDLIILDRSEWTT